MLLASVELSVDLRDVDLDVILVGGLAKFLGTASNGRARI